MKDGNGLFLFPRSPRGGASREMAPRPAPMQTRVLSQPRSPCPQERGTGELTCSLAVFPRQEAELRLVKSLPEILALQRDLVKQFQNVSEADYQSIRAFISSHHEGTSPLQEEVSASGVSGFAETAAASPGLGASVPSAFSAK